MPEDVKPRQEDGIVSIELGVSRRKLMKQLGAAGMIAGLAGCSDLRAEAEAEGDTGGDPVDDSGELPEALRIPFVPPPTEDDIDFENPLDEEREMVFVSHVVDEFFTSVIAGVNDGLNQIGWTGEFLGPSSHDNEEQVEMLNTTVDRLEAGESVLATSVQDGPMYESPVMRAVDNDIPVIHFNTTVDDWDFDFMVEEFGYVQPYVGQDMVSAGMAVGLEAHERAEEKIGDEQLVVQPTIGVPGHPALEARAEGIRAALEDQDGIEVLETLNVSEDLSDATNRIDDAYRSNPDINVIAGTGQWGGIAGATLVENEGLEDEMVVGGFDLNNATLGAIEQGYLDFSSGQDGYSQGYIPTQLAWMYMERGIPMKNFDTGVTVVDEENVDFAMRRDGMWDDLIDYQDSEYDV
ncbi:substrate-binding domain-containing protein [Natronococcus sp. A-GB1]|uniref:substrate-binding domain-containing protein n=1 Tax=Natronococcus sp. A-GB1 TaxID=3037648 RepID=UPI00241FDF3D|nr:substrate-binding domain-containing protein [Natronococcus sp. A-GB1]MDG5761652.1 substrate-binding domain-containing protein [Natronococcus sp. A-GB1]